MPSALFACVNTGIYQGAAGMSAAALWQQAISENLAAQSVPGFKRQQIAFESVEAGALGALTRESQNSPASFVQPNVSFRTDFGSGQLRPTGSNTDLAFQGGGFFAVELPNGDTLYTRDGELRLNGQGQLITKDGYPLLGEGGNLQIDVRNPSSLSITNSGEVMQGRDRRGTLKLVEFNDPNLLRPVGGGYFSAKDTKAQALPNVSGTVRQGFLEVSNSTAVEEMANLITAMRSFEANQKIIHTHDERMGRMIQDLTPNS